MGFLTREGVKGLLMRGAEARSVCAEPILPLPAGNPPSVL